VPIERIRDNGWQLMAGRYKPVHLDTVNHDQPDQILTDVIQMENEIAVQTDKRRYQIMRPHQTISLAACR
jgi:hypothetical protein